MKPCDECPGIEMPPAWDGRTVLSVKAPWADWIVDGHKDVENRTWATSYRGRLYIHASKTEDKGAWEWAFRNLPRWKFEEMKTAAPPILGAIIGHVELIDCTHVSASIWWTGSVAWKLRDPVRTTPQPKRGMLGLWIAGNQP